MCSTTFVAFHASHGDGLDHWSGRTASTLRWKASARRRYRSAMAPMTSAMLGKQGVEGGVALGQALLHAGVEHAVALFDGVEQRRGDDLCTTVAQVFELSGLDGYVAGHAVPFEGLHETLQRCHLAVAPLEPVHAIRGVLDAAPVAAPFDLHALDVNLVAASPPLREQRRVGVRLPDTLNRRVEDALD